MAGLNCEIRWETRLCEVDGELGYFHCWEHWSNVIDASPLRGGHPGGQIGQVYGIVEFKDGDRCHYPDCRHTTDISHALNAPTFPNGFEKVKHNGNVYFVERED